jgi:hypothetical protein
MANLKLRAAEKKIANADMLICSCGETFHEKVADMQLRKWFLQAVELQL